MSATPQPGDVIGGRYELVAPIASGGMGSVWRALHRELETEVAIKLISVSRAGDVALERFRREAKAAAKLKSQHVVHTYDYGIEDGRPYIAMELLEGEDLKRRYGGKKVPLEELVKVFSPVVKALRLAHAHGIVHRDLKPANVFVARVGDEEVIKVLDFGIAKELDGGAQLTTGSGVVLGTPAYMSPEQLRSVDVDARADVWSLSVMVFELLAGQNPFQAEMLPETFARVGWDPLPDIATYRPDASPALKQFFEHGLARAVERRFPDVDAWLAALSALSDKSEGPAAIPAVRGGRDQETIDARDFESAVTAAASTVASTLPADAISSDLTAPPTVAPDPPPSSSRSRRLAMLAGLAAALITVVVVVAYSVAGTPESPSTPASGADAQSGEQSDQPDTSATPDPDVDDDVAPAAGSDVEPEVRPSDAIGSVARDAEPSTPPINPPIPPKSQPTVPPPKASTTASPSPPPSPPSSAVDPVFGVPL